MTATQQFISDAVKGEWEYAQGRQLVSMNGDLFLADTKNPPFGPVKNTTEPVSDYTIASFLLRPDVWQAVGKTRGWNNYDEIYQRLYRKSGGGGLMPNNMNGYMGMMHKFIDYLADGKSIDDALTAITN